MIASMLARAAAQFGSEVAVECSGLATTWAEEAGAVARLAGALRARGLRPGDRLGLLAENGRLALRAHFAAAQAGLVLVPLSWRAHPGGLARLLAHAGATRLLASASLGETGREVVRAHVDGPLALDVADPDFEGEVARAEPAPSHPARPDDPAQIYYTSGTTGEPKGVVLTHRNVSAHALLAAAALKLDDGDVWAHVAPMFHLADAWATFAITWVGGRHVMVPRFEPDAVLDALAGGVTITNLVPTMLGDLVHRPGAAGRDYSRLCRILSGGAPIAPALVARILATFRCEYVQTYGLTETSPYLTMSLLPRGMADRPESERFAAMCRTGRPLAGVEVRVVRDDLTDVRRDGREVGEVVCRGDTVTPGYWRNERATAAAFRDGWFLTGDLAVMDGGGSLQIVDRRKDVIKSGGETIFSTEVESVLLEHSSVKEAAVIGLPDERWGEAVVAVVVARDGAAVDERSLLDHCRTRLGGPQIPKRVIARDSLPRTGSGKIAKRLLRDELART